MLPHVRARGSASLRVSSRGKAPAADRSTHIAAEPYDCEFLRDGQKWRFKRITIDNAWAQGDLEILNALVGHQARRAKSKQSK